MIVLKSMSFINGEEKRKYDALAIEWVKYVDVLHRKGQTAMSFEEYYTKKGVKFNLGNNVQVKEEKSVKTQPIEEKKEEIVKNDDIASLRIKYTQLTGKKPFNAWSAELIQSKINAL